MGSSWNSNAFGVATTMPPFRLLCVQFAGLLAATGSFTCAQIPATSNADRLDSQFLGELRRRQLYDLATDYARDRALRQSPEESKAFWIDQLATVYRNRTWEESAANRLALTEQSIELITEYLQDHTVAPETNLALRLNQIEGLINMARINRLLHVVAHRGPVNDVRRIEPVGVLPFIDRAAELSEGLLKRLDEHQRVLERRRVSMLRERAKRLTAELSVIRHLSTGAVSIEGSSQTKQQSELRNQLKSLERSARQPETRQVAEQLQAELQLAEGDIDGLELTMRHRNSSLTESQRIVLEIRSLLRQGKAIPALQRCDAAVNASANTGSDLSLLRLESLLVLRMQGDELQDASLMEHSDEQFAHGFETAMKWRPSVWRDAATIINQRYQLVDTVGAKVATLVEQVESLRAASQLEEAFRVLQRAIRLLPPKASVQSKAALTLRMGEILIAQKQWENAIPLLHHATQLFGEAEQPKSASTAALLAVFSMGQEWRLHPEDRGLRESYFDGLIQHREQWPSQTTRQQSTEWLVQLTRQIDPIYAAEILAQEAAEDDSFAEQMRRTTELGEQLERARDAAGESRSTKTWTDLTSELLKACDQYELTVGAMTNESARLQLLQTSLGTNADTDRELWYVLRQRLAAASAAITNIDPVTQDRLNRVQLVAAAKTSADSNARRHYKSKYLSETTGDPLQAARRLAHYLNSGGTIRSGDRLIAETIDELIAARIPRTSSPTELSQMLELATLSYHVTSDDSIRNRLLNRLLKLNLTEAHTMEIAAVLMNSVRSGSDVGAAEQAKFWARIHSESKEGCDLWLESCLQLARIQAQQGKTEEAARQLRVTAVIYPDWGSEKRRQRVDDFLRDR